MSKSWDKFLRNIQIAKHKLSCSRSGAWYRGHSTQEYTLTPTLFRKKTNNRNTEREIFQKFARRFDRHGGSWDVLVDMQHHSQDTRLLDWTEAFGVALYFAVYPFDDTAPESPCIWITNPFTLSAKAQCKNDLALRAFHYEEDMDYYNLFINSDNWPFERPIPYFAPGSNPRIMAQRGFFTIHGHNSEPLEIQCPKYVRRVDLPLEAVKEAKEFLELAGINKISLFPDNKEIFQTYIKNKYRD